MVDNGKQPDNIHIFIYVRICDLVIIKKNGQRIKIRTNKIWWTAKFNGMNSKSMPCVRHVRHFSTICHSSTLFYWGSIKVLWNLICEKESVSSSSWYVLTRAIFPNLQPHLNCEEVTRECVPSVSSHIHLGRRVADVHIFIHVLDSYSYAYLVNGD